MTSLLRVIGANTDKEILDLFKCKENAKKSIEQTLAKDHAKTAEESFIEIHKKLRDGDLANVENAKEFIRSIFNEEQRIAILGTQYRELVYDTDPFKVFKNYYQKVSDLDIMDQHYYVDAMTWLTDDILVKVDRATMYSSIEARAPYLDPILAEFAASIPVSIKFKNNKKKYILKKALKNQLPSFVINKKKSGFNSPINEWLPNSTEHNEFRAFNRFVFDQKLNGIIW